MGNRVEAVVLVLMAVLALLVLAGIVAVLWMAGGSPSAAPRSSMGLPSGAKHGSALPGEALADDFFEPVAPRVAGARADGRVAVNGAAGTEASDHPPSDGPRESDGRSAPDLPNGTSPGWTSQVALRWRDGDRWVVGTFRRDLAVPEMPWVGPSWSRYVVIGRGPFRDATATEVEVTRVIDADGSDVIPGEPATRFYVAEEGVRLLAVKRRVREGQTETDRVYAAEIAAAEMASAIAGIPFHLPGGRPSGPKVRPADLALSAILPGGGEAPRWVRDAWDALPESIQVEFEDPLEGGRVLQWWDAAEGRWPLFTVTRNTVSFRPR